MNNPTLYGLLQVRNQLADDGFSLPLVETKFMEGNNLQSMFPPSDGIVYTNLEFLIKKEHPNANIENVRLLNRRDNNQLIFVNWAIAENMIDLFVPLVHSECNILVSGSVAFTSYVKVYAETLEKLSCKKENVFLEFMERCGIPTI